MKRYLKKLVLCVGIPIAGLTAIYFITDPFCVLKPFSLDYFDDANRDYTSVELYMANKETHHYNSFIFGSCGLGGINSYHWQSKLNEGDEQFVFQSWGETLTGIEDKIIWLHENNEPIANAMIMIDIPSTFSPDQLSSKAVLMHNPKMSRVSECKWHWDMYFNYIQKPSFWVESVQKWCKRVCRGEKPEVTFDTVTNDQFARSGTGFLNMPKQDSMRRATPRLLDVLAYRKKHSGSEGQNVSEPLINSEFTKQLKNIKRIFDEYGTSYRVFVKPGVVFASSRINEDDLSILNTIFGKDNVFDYSGDNEISRDLNHFRDSEHYGLSAGWLMVEEMYGGRQISRYE